MRLSIQQSPDTAILSWKELQMKESFSGYYYEKKHRVKKKKIQMLPEESADIMEQQILDTLSHDSTQ